MEAAVISDFRNGFIRIGKLFTGGLHTVIIQVIQRCAMSQFAEIAAEIISVHIGAGCQIGKPDIFRIMIINKGEYFFQMQYFFCVLIAGTRE